jgi:hypothetical protein
MGHRIGLPELFKVIYLKFLVRDEIERRWEVVIEWYSSGWAISRTKDS